MDYNVRQRSSTKLLGAFLSAGLFTGCSDANAAFCLNGHPSIKAEYAEAEFVVEAKIAKIVRNTRVTSSYKGKKYRETVDRVTFRVVKSYKGTPRSLSFDNSQDSAAFPVNVGDGVLAFVRQRTDGSLFVDTCGSSDIASRVDRATYRALRDLASHK